MTYDVLTGMLNPSRSLALFLSILLRGLFGGQTSYRSKNFATFIDNFRVIAKVRTTVAKIPFNNSSGTHHVADHHQSLTACCHSHISPRQKDSANFVDNFLSCPAVRQTEKSK